MSNPVDRIKTLMTDRPPTVGKVITIEGSVATVGTNDGPKKVSIGANALRVGDKVQITGGSIVGRLRRGSEVPIVRI